VSLSVTNEREIAVLQQLHQRFSHVSAERVISGPGLVTLYDALCGVEGVVPEALSPPEITKRAQEGTCRLCFETVSMFCALLGTMAGNLVLTLGALGGAYIGGGIAPELGTMFTSSRFRDRFEDKGRFTDYVSRVPTFLIRAELPALLGLASAFTDPGPRLEAD
jgi:glucokinase